MSEKEQYLAIILGSISFPNWECYGNSADDPLTFFAVYMS